MKKTALLCILLCSAGLCAMLPQTQPKTAEHHQVNMDAINALLQRASYDSVILYCLDTARHIDYDMRELALANAWWHKGDKSKAYQYVQNNADYEQRLNGGGGYPFRMLYDYRFGNALATDTFLEKMLVDKVTDYYRLLEYYPDRYSGVKLLLLSYKQEKLKAKYEYELGLCAATDCRERLKSGYERDCQAVADVLLDMLAEHGKLYSRNDAGPAALLQFRMLCDLNKEEDHAKTLPLFYQAMISQEIQPDIYVDAVVAAGKLRGNDEMLQNRLRDSLCSIYHCTRLSRDSINKLTGTYPILITDKGDTIRYRDADK